MTWTLEVLLGRAIGYGSKRKPLGTRGFSLFFLLPIGFFRYPVFLTHSLLASHWFLASKGQRAFPVKSLGLLDLLGASSVDEPRCLFSCGFFVWFAWPVAKRFGGCDLFGVGFFFLETVGWTSPHRGSPRSGWWKWPPERRRSSGHAHGTCI